MRRASYGIALFVTTITLGGCVALAPPARVFAGHGPPPHAPAHGYRHQHQGVEFVFESNLGVHVVLGHPNHFYHDGLFLRVRGGTWEASARLDGPWRPYSTASLPPGLRKAHHGKAKGHPRKSHPPAKGDW